MNSKLLKEAIADARAVRETALANAKIALEEAFTPKLQSMLSRKLKEEFESEDDEDEDEIKENDESSQIGKGDNKMPAKKTFSSSADKLELGKAGVKKQTAPFGLEDPNRTKVKDINLDESLEDDEDDQDGGDVTGASADTGINEDEDPETTLDDYADGEIAGAEVSEGDADEDELTEDDLDLDEIIRELEGEVEDDEPLDEDDDTLEIEDEPTTEGEEWFDKQEPDASSHQISRKGGVSAPADFVHDDEDEIDLDEILREMGYGDEGEDESPELEEGDDDTLEIGDDASDEVDALKQEVEEKDKEIEQAMEAIRSLKGTINEVNLLNAKLLYVNKLFRSYNLTNEQKTKVVETLDRTKNVREVKLVFSTIAESFKYGNGVSKKPATKLTESYRTKTAKSTAPAKQIISENTVAARFKKLAGINK